MEPVAKKAANPNEYEERRETLVVEQKTSVDEAVQLEESKKVRIGKLLHSDPKSAAKMNYILCPTGLIRHITITQADLDRLGDA